MTTGNRPANRRDALTASPGRETPAAGPAAREHELRTLSADECFDLLQLGGIGRVGFASAAGIVMLPVNFAVTEKTVIVRTAPDSTSWLSTPMARSASRSTISTRSSMKAGASWCKVARTWSRTSVR